MTKTCLAALLPAIAPGWLLAQQDPLTAALDGELKSTVEVFLGRQSEQRRYKNGDFPMPAERFAEFKADLVAELTKGLGLESWTVRNPDGKQSPVAHLFEDRIVEKTMLHDVAVEIHAVALKPAGLVVPMVLCLPPEGAENAPVPGVCVYSGHTQHGLKDLALNLDSYQRGIAIRLARAGFATIAVEKIDTGYLSRHGAKGVDEKELATLLLHRGDVLRSHQMRACLAATEILAAHPRVDETRLGAAGVSLGGWLSVQTAMLNDRIRAVADFGRKTRSVSPAMTAALYRGQGDLCHIIPGMLSVCDRNLMPLALAPMPMLAGHGINDKGSHAEHAAEYRELGEQQYLALGAPGAYTYLVHGGGDTMPDKEAIAWFANVLSDPDNAAAARLLFQSGHEGYPRYRIPSLVVANGGDLLAICEGRADGGGLTGNVDLVFKRSTDLGATWSGLTRIADAGDDTLGNASALVDRESGVIWIAGTISPGEHLEAAIAKGETEESTRVFVVSSRDEGQTWTQPRNITAAVKKPGWTWYGCGPGVGIQLKNGRLLFPAYHREGQNGETVCSHAIFSDDGGLTWNLSQNAGAGNGEPQALQREDGSIYLSARTSGDGPNLRSIVESTDGGATWGDKRFDQSLYDAHCQASLLKLPPAANSKSRWLYAHPAGPDRNDLTIRLSHDEGRSWDAGALLLRKGNSQYSSMALLPDGRVGVLFDCWENGNYQLYFTTFLPEEIQVSARGLKPRG